MKILSAILVLLALAFVGEARAQTQTANFVLTWQDNSGIVSPTNCSPTAKTCDAEDGFNVERGTATTGPFANVGSVGPNVVTFTDTILKDSGNNAYCWRVNAFTKTAVSGYSNVACMNSPTINTGPISPVIKSITVTVTVDLN